MSMTTRAEILERICDILEQDFECPREKLTEDVTLFETLDLDSIDAVDLIVRLQNVLKKKVNPADFKQIRTLGDVVDAIEKLVNTPADA